MPNTTVIIMLPSYVKAVPDRPACDLSHILCRVLNTYKKKHNSLFTNAYNLIR